MRPENRIFDPFPGRFSREKYLHGLDILVDRTPSLEEEILSWSREFRVAL